MSEKIMLMIKNFQLFTKNKAYIYNLYNCQYVFNNTVIK